MSKAKSFSISRRLVSMAYQKVRSNKGAGGVDGVSLEAFHEGYRDHLYKLEPDEFRELYATTGEIARDPEERRWTKTSGHTPP